MRLIDMLFDGLVVECRNGIPEALGSNPGRVQYFLPPVTDLKINTRSYWLKYLAIQLEVLLLSNIDNPSD